MFAPAHQSRFTLTFDDGSDLGLKVLEFKGKEAISQPYRFELELVSERANIELESLLHRQAFLKIDGRNSGIHGQVFRVGQGGTGQRWTYYQISLVPRLAYLERRLNQRVFQRQTVPQIIESVLKDHGIFEEVHFKCLLSGRYPEREYCVQYAESDLRFIQRLCAETGIHYHFQHGPDGHLLVFGDDQTVFPRLVAATPYRPGSGMAAQTPVIKRFDVRLETRTTAFTRWNYDFQKPHLQLESSLNNQQLPALEDYQFPGAFADENDGRQLAQRGLQRHNADYQQAEGASDESALVSGHFLRLAEHSREAWNDLWLITQVEHRGRQPQVLEAAAPTDDSDAFQGYRNTFLATPWNVFYRPPMVEKPRASGLQSAVVTGPEGSEIYCDEYGRVKVLLAWDRVSTRNESSSCWLRVATGWASDRYGSVLTPRVGMEVLVGFIDGDPDKPLIMGCAPNALNRVPLDLPADNTRSIFRSQSSPGGGGYNELRIEDRKGAEEIYLRAQRNWNQDVLGDMQVQVRRQRDVLIGRAADPSSVDNLQVFGDRHVRVSNESHRASGQFHVSAVEQVVIDGGVNVSIQAGGHWINIGPAGIFSSVPIVVGGVPMPTMGGIGKAAPSPAPLSEAQIRNLKSDAPFCEECLRCAEGLCTTPQALNGGNKASGSSAASSVEPGFHIVEQSLSRAALESLLLPNPSPTVLAKFRSLNPQLSGYAKPGQLIVLSDPRNTQCTREEALLMEAAQKVDAALEPMSDAEAEFMALHHNEIESFLTEGATAVGIGAAMFGKHLTNLTRTLGELETLHTRTFNRHGKLSGADFFNERKRLMAQLDSSLGPLVRKGVGIPEHRKLKNALGISSRSLVHHWSKAGTAGGIPGYATHIEGVSKASKVIKAGGWVGVGLGVGASGLKVKETCRVGAEEACRKVRFTEAGKFGGALAGGTAGGLAGIAIGGGVCAAIGVGTVGVGGLICGLVFVGVGSGAGGNYLGSLGEAFGEVMYEVLSYAK